MLEARRSDCEEDIERLRSQEPNARQRQNRESYQRAGAGMSGGEGEALLQIRGLRKTFTVDSTGRGHGQVGGVGAEGGGRIVAVDDMHLDLYPGQIFALLGHNGAGKSTTISMLTGLLTPTRGDAVVLGQYLVSRDMQDIFGMMGVCAQDNRLVPDLTVLEHLHLFDAIKGNQRPQPHSPGTEGVEETGLALVTQLGLGDKLHCRAKRLSGGQQRKLCLALALLGDSPICYLDEPTSGMDPFSRRATWEVLRRQARQGRCIILTTHFMDEGTEQSQPNHLRQPQQIKINQSPCHSLQRTSWATASPSCTRDRYNAAAPPSSSKTGNPPAHSPRPNYRI